MVMTENNDRLLESFFAENRQEIADNGFSRRVMHHLPNRSNRLARLWTAGGFTLAIILFVCLDGVKEVLNAFGGIFEQTIQNSNMQIDPKSMLVAAIVLLYLGYRKIASLA